MKKINNKGFTFIELLVYVGILSIFMVAVVTLISSTVASNRKLNARKRLQTQATETYDVISDMLMSATDVKISGTAYIQTTTAGATSYSPQRGNYIVAPYDAANPDKYYKDNDGVWRLTSNNAIYGTFFKSPGAGGGTNHGLNSYDIADIKSFTTVSSGMPSEDPETLIDVEYLYIKYASDLTDTGDTVYTACTLQFDKTNHVLSVYRQRSDASGFGMVDGYFIENTSGIDDVLCKNVANFQLQVNPDTGSFAIILELDDEKTTASYEMLGVVSLRNSFVLKQHAW